MPPDSPFSRPGPLSAVLRGSVPLRESKRPHTEKHRNMECRRHEAAFPHGVTTRPPPSKNEAQHSQKASIYSQFMRTHYRLGGFFHCCRPKNLLIYP